MVTEWIGIFSDTHGWLDLQLEKDFADCRQVWHAGDLGNTDVIEPFRKKEKLRVVYGNIDGADARSLFSEWTFFEVQGFPVLMVHIAGKHPRYTPLVKELIQKLKPKMLVCGHSHICRVVMEGGILYVNPGAAGRHGFHQLRTALKIGFREGKPVEVRVLELGPRSERATGGQTSIPM
jgi:putative phosphoesterase